MKCIMRSPEFDFKAIDHVVKIVRELDRYHGFAAPRRGQEPEPGPAALTASAPQALALAPPCAERIDNDAVTN